MPTKPNPPYLGAAYYPEDWPLEQVDEDISLMKEAGMNVMRVGEFAWSSMEPEEGRYDFGWLHTVVSKLADAGIATIMGTPTCTPPAWLVERYPEVLFVKSDGTPLQHGMRRHYCPNNPVYLDHCRRIVTQMAQEFGQDDRIIGWQIDNELFPGVFEFMSCSCPVCIRKFQDWMRERFGTIDALNKAWCTNLWSQTYNSFSQLPFPRPGEWHHPSLLNAWREFANESYIEFSNIQADILHELTTQPVGTDMMMHLGLDHYRINQKLDVVQYNHYHMREHLWQSAFWFDYIRPIKDVPFWNTETATCWGGNVATSGYCEEGFCRANSWMPIMMGGEANLYWLWRTHWAGHELMHGAVISSPGRPMHIWEEVREVSRGFAAASDFLNGTRPVQSGLALHFSNSAYLLYKDQRMVNGFDYLATFLTRIYQPLMESQFRPDVIQPSVDLSSYRMIVTPMLPALDEGGLRERLAKWVEDGGTLVIGPLSDIRTSDATKFTHAPYGSIEDWGGVWCKYQIPGEPRDFKLQWNDGALSQGSLWYDGLELRGAEALATYTEGPLAGLAAVTQRAMGKGRIIVLATLPTPEDLMKLLRPLTRETGIEPAVHASPTLLAIPRSGEQGEGLCVVEHSNQPASLTLPRPAVDLITGIEYSGQVEVSAYGVMVLRYK